MKKRGAMRYIVRVDSGSTHCYHVRIGYQIDCKVNKSFADRKCGGKAKALKLAKQWRDQQLKELLPIMANRYKYDINGQRHWGNGWDENWTNKSNGWSYLNIKARYYDSKNNKQLTKTFSVNKYGYDKAVKLAKQWRKLKVTGKL